MTKELELQEFYDKLEKHDWFYYYSDDRKVYAAGQKNETCIHNEAASKGLEFLSLLRFYKDYTNSNGALMKPARPGGPKPVETKPLFKDDIGF